MSKRNDYELQDAEEVGQAVPELMEVAVDAAPAAPAPAHPAEHWARKHGMWEPLLEQATVRGKSDAQGLVRGRAIPGRLNPKFDAFNQARAHHGWGPTHEMTEEEFLAALEAPKAHVFR